MGLHFDPDRTAGPAYNKSQPIAYAEAALRLAMACAFSCLGGCASAPRVAETFEAGFQRGVALGFVDARVHSTPSPGPNPSPGGAFVNDAFPRSLRETRSLGADHVSILVPIYTAGVHGARVRRGLLDDARGGDGSVEPTRTEDHEEEAAAQAAEQEGDRALFAAIFAARAAGHEVMVFPLVRLRVRLPGEWRGKLAPPDRDAWFESYARSILAIARIAERGGASRLVIGSELVSFEHAEGGDPERWRDLARRVRAVFRGRLVYSANWDRYEDVPFWDAVDEVGISAYFSLAARGANPSVPELVAAWQPITEALARFSARVQRRIVFTEVGFPSVSGAAYWPWNDHQAKLVCAAGEGCEGALDLEAQRRLWAAFVRVFSQRRATSFVCGVYAWLWAGAGGLRDRGYMPRGKPAESVLKLWYAGDQFHPPPR